MHIIFYYFLVKHLKYVQQSLPSLPFLPALQHLQSHVGEVLGELVALRVAGGAAPPPPAVAVTSVISRGASGGPATPAQSDAAALGHRLLQLLKENKAIGCVWTKGVRLLLTR